MITTKTGNGQKSGDRMAELLAAAERREKAMAESGYRMWVVENLARGEAWASQDRGLAPRTRKSKILEQAALTEGRRAWSKALRQALRRTKARQGNG